MSRKTSLSKRKAKRQIKVKDNKAETVSLTETKKPVKRRTKFYAFICVLLLLNGIVYSYWLTNIFDDAPKAPTTLAKNLPNPNKKTKSELPADFDLPPQNAPIDRGYNASSGQFPPGALPSGVSLPGISSHNSTIQARTMDQGYGVTDGIRQNFTGQIRDEESNLLYYGARYYNPQHGRFTSVDPRNAGASLTEPQSWNGYAYGGNNPLKFIDFLGLWKQVPCSTGGQEGQCYEAEEGDTYASLAKQSWWLGENGLKSFFGNQEITTGQVFDVSGYGSYLRQIVDNDMDNRPYLYNPPITGGVVKPSGSGGSGFFSRLWNGVKNVFGSGSKSATATFAGGVTREAIERAAADPGGTVRVVTNLTQAPQSGRALSVAVGEGAEQLAGAARGGGQMFTANIPKALIETLKTAGLVEQRATMMGGVQATELYFRPEAAEFIVKFFR